MAANWAERVSAFSRSPSRFLSGTTADAFLAELLRELRDDRAPDSVKVLLLAPICEHPTLLCPSDSTGEETALELMSVFALCPLKSVQLRCHLLLALTSVLICTSRVNHRSHASLDSLDLLLQVAQDTGDLHGDGALRPLRGMACECLRELETCCPGFLSHHLELLSGLQHKETSGLHQAYAGLRALVLRNCVYQLAQEPHAGAAHLKALLGENTSVCWEADQDSALLKDSTILSSLILGSTGPVPILQTGCDCKELRSVLSSLLEESYLFTSLCQAALFHRLIELVAMVPGVTPSIFRAQLLRLLGTSEVGLFHSTLLMKCAFTDSLFSADDEAFVLKRLVVLSQHPLLSAPQKLFYMECVLHFPENRPISCGDSDEALPVLLTPRLASSLLPTVFNDSSTMLARLHLLCLLYLEEGEDGEGGLALLHEHLTSLLSILANRGSREVVVTFFRAAFLFLLYFPHVERYCSSITEKLCALYRRHAHLAPHLINLADRTGERLSEWNWAVGLLTALQEVITQAPPAQLAFHDLGWHMKTLARVSEEGEIPPHGTLAYLSSIIAPPASPLCSSSDWRMGKAVLRVCRRLLVHPSLDAVLIPLADVLQQLACSYGDTDIQDHARLYYTLVTSLSREKLVGVLAQGEREGRHPVKKRSLSSIVADSDGLSSALTFHQTEKAVVRLLELSKAQEETRPVKDAEDGGGLEAYRAQFTDPGFASEISLDYQLTHADPPDPRFLQLFNIRLHFQLTDRHYEDICDVSVPCLLGERPSPVVTLTLRPRRPLPTTLLTSAIFTAHDGLSWHTLLPDTHVTFQQTFRPLPAPPTWGVADKLRVFEGLWDEICNEEGPADHATSLFCCQLGALELGALMEKHFLPFLLSDPSHEEFRVLLFLPPQSHILLRVRAEEDAAVFDIATDNWQLLPHINSCLKTFTSSCQHGNDS